MTLLYLFSSSSHPFLALPRPSLCHTVGFLSRSLAARRLALLALPPSAARKTTSRRVFLFPPFRLRCAHQEAETPFCPPTWCLLARFPRLAPSGNYPRFTGMRAELSENVSPRLESLYEILVKVRCVFVFKNIFSTNAFYYVHVCTAKY